AATAISAIQAQGGRAGRAAPAAPGPAGTGRTGWVPVVMSMPPCSPGRAPRHIGRPGEFPARPGGAGPGPGRPPAPPAVAVAGSAFRGIPRSRTAPYHRVVTLAGLPRSLAQPLAARLAGLPPRRQELVQDLGLGIALAIVNVVSLLPYRAQLHPLWLALVLVAAQGVPLAWRR